MFFIGRSEFSDDLSENVLIFQPIFNTFTMPAGTTDTVMESESKEMSNEKTKPPITANNSFSPKLKWMHNLEIKVEFKVSYLKQDNLKQGNFYSKKSMNI